MPLAPTRLSMSNAIQVVNSNVDNDLASDGPKRVFRH